MSEPAHSSWRRHGAWHGILAAGRFGAQDGPAGLIVTPAEERGVATVIGRNGDALDHYFARVHALTPPRAPAVAAGTGCALVWTGPDQWLAFADDRSLPARLVEALGDNAAVSDQSDARAILYLRGPRLRDALAKGCPIDLHPQAFAPGDAAVTAIAHMGVHLWWLPDDDGLKANQTITVEDAINIRGLPPNPRTTPRSLSLKLSAAAKRNSPSL